MKYRTWMWTTTVCLSTALTIPVRSAAQDNPDHQPIITTFDVPGAGTGAYQGTYVDAINAKGAITGYSIDANGIGHGFLRDCKGYGFERGCDESQGTITSFDVPGDVQGTWPAAINAEGDVTGYYCDDISCYGFLRDREGNFTIFNPPGANSYGPTPLGIDSEGTIMGSYEDANNLGHGFVRARDGTFSSFDVPGAATTAYLGTTVNSISTGGRVEVANGAINPEGEIAGSYFIETGTGGFLRARDGSITAFEVPGGKITSAADINLSGAITGSYYEPSSFDFRGFLRTRDGTFTTFAAAPSASCCLYTFPQGINAEGVIAGFDNDDLGIYHGFQMDRNGTITLFDAHGAGTGVYQGTLPQGINGKGTIAGYYLDSNNVRHGFVRDCDREGHGQQ
jgi:hypothetical protein